MWPPTANQRGPRFGVQFASKFKLDGTTVCIVPRAASRSMVQTLRAAGAEPENIPEGRCVMWIRHPFDRFATVAMMFGKSYGDGKFQNLADNILLGDYNQHWWPQTDLHPEASIIYPFDTLHDTWKIEFPDLPLRWENKSGQKGVARVPWDEIEPQLNPETVTALREYYAKDFQAYELSLTR